MPADNGFGRFFNRVGDVIWLNLLWVVCSLPLVTIGAATTAAYAAVFQWNETDVHSTARSFFAAFRANLKQSTVTWLLCVAGSAAGLNLLRAAASLDGIASQALYAVSVFFLAILLVYALLAFPIIAKFNVSTKQAFTNAMYLLVRHTWSVLIALLTTAAGIYVTYFVAPPIFAVLAGLLIYLNGIVFRQVFQKILVNSNDL